MKKLFYNYSIGGLLLFIAVSLYPSNLFSQVTVTYIPSEETVYSDVVKAMRTVEEKRFHDPDAPRFLLVDQKQKFAFGIGGYVRLTNGVEFNGIIPSGTNQGFQPALIPSSYEGYPRSQYRLSAATSEIFAKMVGDSKRLGKIIVYISTNFQGDNYTPQLRQAYISFMGFTFGQAWSTITDLNATPPTIDYASPNGWVNKINPMIRYQRTFKDHWKVALAAEFPSVDGTYSSVTNSVAQSVPDIIGYLQYGWGDNMASHIRFSGIMRNMSYRDNIVKHTDIKSGWGVQASGINPITSKLKMFYQFCYGKGIGSYINDISLINMDLVPDNNRPGTMDVLPMYGFYGGLQYNFTNNLFISSTYSQARIYNEGDFASGGMYKYGQYFVANMFWNVTPECQLGIEYLYGRKTTFNNTFNHANRANLMVQYNF